MSVGMLSMSPRSKLWVGIIPGPTLFRGGRAAGAGGACAENWLGRRVRMDMLLGGWGSEGVLAPDAGMPPLALRAADWLKRRAKELLRAGRVWPGVPVKVGMVFVLVFAMVTVVLLLLLLLVYVESAGTLLMKEPGAGKSLRAGS